MWCSLGTGRRQITDINQCNLIYFLYANNLLCSISIVITVFWTLERLMCGWAFGNAVAAQPHENQY